jgi:hypothetical protein
LIKCDFGGANESFTLCGSEDGCVYIWSREKAEVIAKLGFSSDGGPDIQRKKKSKKLGI